MKHALVTAGNLKYLPGIVAALQSARRFHPEADQFCYVPLEEVEEARARLGHLGATILAPPRAIRGVPDNYQMAAVRVFAATLPYDVVLWLDGDAIFTAPAPELWQVTPGMINGVKSGENQTVITGIAPDMKAQFRERFPDAVGLQVMNTGVIALRPQDWSDLPEQFEALIERGGLPRYDVWHDQPLLNVIFAGKINWMSRAYNASDLYDLGVPDDVRIMHYTGKNKPWHDDYNHSVPMYDYWLRYGLGETRFMPLLLSRLRIVIATPKRFVGQWLRRRREAAEERAKGDAV